MSLLCQGYVVNILGAEHEVLLSAAEQSTPSFGSHESRAPADDDAVTPEGAMSPTPGYERLPELCRTVAGTEEGGGGSPRSWKCAGCCNLYVAGRRKSDGEGLAQGKDRGPESVETVALRAQFSAVSLSANAGAVSAAPSFIPDSNDVLG